MQFAWTPFSLHCRTLPSIFPPVCNCLIPFTPVSAGSVRLTIFIMRNQRMFFCEHRVVAMQQEKQSWPQNCQPPTT